MARRTRSNGSSSGDERRRRTSPPGGRSPVAARGAAGRGRPGRRVSPGSRAPRGPSRRTYRRVSPPPGRSEGGGRPRSGRRRSPASGVRRWRRSSVRGRAAGVEAAAARRQHRRGRLALDRRSAGVDRLRRVGHRDRLEQHPGVRVGRVAYSASLGATSHILPRYITATRSLMFLTTARSWAMKTRVSPSPRLEVLEQVEDLRLDAHVERRDRLVADDQRRGRAPARGRSRCAGTGRPRTGVGGSRRRAAGRCPTSSSAVDDRARVRPSCRRSRSPSGSATMSLDLAPRVQRRDRILEDHLHAGARRAHLLRRRAR